MKRKRRAKSQAEKVLDEFTRGIQGAMVKAARGGMPVEFIAVLAIKWTAWTILSATEDPKKVRDVLFSAVQFAVQRTNEPDLLKFVKATKGKKRKKRERN
jgi:hypothetical protein